MIRTRADIEQVRYCREQLDNWKDRPSGKFERGEMHVLFGMIAETVIADYLAEPRPVIDGKADEGYDVVINGVKVDVKCTLRNVKPLLRYEAPVADVQAKDKIDAYLFLSCTPSKNYYYVMGWLTKEEFLRKAKYTRAGEALPSDSNKTHRQEGHGCHHVQYKHLNRINSWEDIKKIHL